MMGANVQRFAETCSKRIMYDKNKVRILSGQDGRMRFRTGSPPAPRRNLAQLRRAMLRNLCGAEANEKCGCFKLAYVGRKGNSSFRGGVVDAVLFQPRLPSRNTHAFQSFHELGGGMPPRSFSPYAEPVPRKMKAV